MDQMTPPREITGDHLVEHTRMWIDLDPQRTAVRTALRIGRHPDAPVDAPLVLDGRDLELTSVAIDGRPLALDTVVRTPESITVPMRLTDDETVEVTVESTAVPGGIDDEGFSVRGSMMSTACEPQSFRRISYGIDRPSQRSTYDVTVAADAVRFPLLRANGTLVDEGRCSAGEGRARHWRRYVDPVPKPTYLFAVVAGDLAERSSTHRCGSGQAVTLTVVADPAIIDGSGYALDLLARAMDWDEAHGGVPYDLPELACVAVPSYPGDACECHGLMLFETNTLVLQPTGFTDDDLWPILANVAHEYMHHVRGNRVTVTTWRDLPLKEGLTVLAQHDFREHVHGPVGRIMDVADLRRMQFPEETSIGAPVVQGHDRRAESLYTRTTYLKGGEVFRMLRNAIGEVAWAQALACFVARHDLGSATLEEFLDELRDHADPLAADVLAGVVRWFSLAGRPALSIHTERVDDRTRVRIRRTDSLTEDPPVAIPVATAVISSDGTAHTEQVLVLRDREATFDVAAGPGSVVSVLRGYSAPVDVCVERSADDAATVIVDDPDPVARWLAAEELMSSAVGAIRRDDSRAAYATIDVLAGALRIVLRTASDQPAIVAHLLCLPDEHALGDRDPIVDVDGVRSGLDRVSQYLGNALAPELFSAIDAGHDDAGASTAHDVGLRSLADSCLALLLATGSSQAIDLGFARVGSPDPTTALRALAQLLHHDPLGVDAAAERLYERWRSAPALIDRWVRAHSGSRGAGTIERVRGLLRLPEYDRTRRGSVMAVWFPFCTRNRSRFHDVSGDGYRLFVDEAIELLAVNPGPVLRVAGDLVQFRRFDEHRRALMVEQLRRLVATPGLPAFAAPMLRRALRDA